MNALIWKDGGYNMKTAGDYAVTKHEMDRVHGRWEYIAYHKGQWLGSFDSFADASAACTNHGVNRK